MGISRKVNEAGFHYVYDILGARLSAIRLSLIILAVLRTTQCSSSVCASQRLCHRAAERDNILDGALRVFQLFLCVLLRRQFQNWLVKQNQPFQS